MEGTELGPVAPARGVCEVIVYTPQHEGSLAGMSVDHLERLIHVWIDRTRALGALEEIQYVYIFENKGTAIGVTLHHPHGHATQFRLRGEVQLPESTTRRHAETVV